MCPAQLQTVLVLLYPPADSDYTCINIHGCVSPLSCSDNVIVPSTRPHMHIQRTGANRIHAIAITLFHILRVTKAWVILDDIGT